MTTYPANITLHTVSFGWQWRKKTKLIVSYSSNGNLQYVQAYVPINIDVRMEARCLEFDLGSLERILRREGQWQLVISSFKDGIFAAADRPFPAKYVVFLGEGRYPRITTHLRIIKSKLEWVLELTKTQINVAPYDTKQ